MERPELTLQASLFPQEKLINISQIKNANLDEPLTMGIYLLILEKFLCTQGNPTCMNFGDF